MRVVDFCTDSIVLLLNRIVVATWRTTESAFCAHSPTNHTHGRDQAVLQRNDMVYQRNILLTEGKH